jgi:hypothetical protein
LDIELKRLTILAAACLALAACGSDKSPGGDVADVAEAELTGNTGQVLSVIQVPGYTYVEVRNNGRNLWLAGNPIEVAEGEIISWADSAMMRNFESKALNRTFEELMFVSAFKAPPRRRHRRPPQTLASCDPRKTRLATPTSNARPIRASWSGWRLRRPTWPWARG